MKSRSLWAFAALSAIVWLTQLRMPEPPAGHQIDPSWATSLGYALLFEMQWGVETVFTFGPLGYFARAPYVAELFATKVFVWEVAFKGLVAATVARAALDVEGRANRWMVILALVLPFFDYDATFYVAIFAASLVALRPGGWGWPALAGVVLGVVALVKFTYLLLAIWSLGLVLVSLARRRRSAALAFGSSAALAFAGTWFACGQSVANFASYLQTSLWLTADYSAAMSLEGPLVELVLAWLVLVTAFVLLALRVVRRSRDVDAWVVGGLTVLALLLSYKGGFTRQDFNGPINFFAFAGVATLLATAASPGSRPVLVARLGVLVTCLVAYGLPRDREGAGPPVLGYGTVVHAAQSLRDLVGLRAFEDRRRAELEDARRTYALPEIRARVGDRPVDLLGNHQGVLFVNGLSWAPRPVFQSYAAFSGRVAELNARFYAGEEAPDFVILTEQRLGPSMPNMIDSLALEEVLRRYRAVMFEETYILLERRLGPARAGERALVLEDTVELGATLALPDLSSGTHVLAIDTEKTAYGAARTLRVRAPVPWIELSLSDGRKTRHRLFPSLAARGVLIEPYLPGRLRWIDWLSGKPVPRVEAIRVFSREGGLARDVGVRVYRDRSLRGR